VLARAEGQSTGRSLFEAALVGGAQALSARGGAAATSEAAGGGARHASTSANARGGTTATASATPSLQTSGFEPGAYADIVSLSADHPALAERHGDEILDSWIFVGSRGAIDCVWRAGEKVVIHGRHRRRDELLSRYRRTIKGLLA
jgi:cytosine/adenosine deaminase-related metal-dependent hydrolase